MIEACVDRRWPAENRGVRSHADIPQRTLLRPSLSPLLPARAVAQDKVVNVYNWSDYIDEEVLEEFTEETGIKVVYDVYDSNEIAGDQAARRRLRLRRRRAVRPQFLARQIQAGVFQKLDKSKLPEPRQRLARHRRAARRPTIPATSTPSTTCGARPASATTSTRSRSACRTRRSIPGRMIFDPDVVAKFADCGVHVLDAPDDMLPAALNYLGLTPTVKEPADLEKAAELLKASAPTSRSSTPPNTSTRWPTATSAWRSAIRATSCRRATAPTEAGNGVEIDYSIPKEGALIWFDQMAIPADAPHPGRCARLHQLHAAARRSRRASSNFVYYANGNLASQELLDEEVIATIRRSIPMPGDDGEALHQAAVRADACSALITRVWTDVEDGPVERSTGSGRGPRAAA